MQLQWLWVPLVARTVRAQGFSMHTEPSTVALLFEQVGVMPTWVRVHHGQSIKRYIKPKWLARNFWIREVFWSQHLGCWGQNTSRIQHKEV